jgi:hypothetical protein
MRGTDNPLGTTQGRSKPMNRDRKISAPVTLFATIEAEQHEALRTIAFNERRSIADVVREAIDKFVKRDSEDVPVGVLSDERISSRRS